MTKKADPIWVRQTLIEDLADIDKRQGKLPDLRSAEAEVDRVIQLAEAEEREAPYEYAPTIDYSSAREARKRLLGFADVGKQAKQRAQSVWSVADPKLQRLTVRIAALLQRFGPGPLDFEYPELATAILLEFFQMKTRSEDYQRLRDDEAERLLRRRLEDIADKSCGLPGFGPWY